MASSTGFFKPPILNLGVDRYASFKQWKARWEDYVIVSELGKKDPEYQGSGQKLSGREGCK